MGLNIPRLVPSTLHEIVEYAPSVTEWKITAGIGAFGQLILTVVLNVAVAVFANPGTCTPSSKRQYFPVSRRGAQKAELTRTEDAIRKIHCHLSLCVALVDVTGGAEKSGTVQGVVRYTAKCRVSTQSSCTSQSILTGLPWHLKLSHASPASMST